MTTRTYIALAVACVVGAGSLLTGCSGGTGDIDPGGGTGERQYATFTLAGSPEAAVAVRGTLTPVNGVSLTSPDSGYDGFAGWAEKDGGGSTIDGWVSVDNVSTGGTMTDIEVEVTSINTSAVTCKQSGWTYADTPQGDSTGWMRWTFTDSRASGTTEYRTFEAQIQVSWIPSSAGIRTTDAVFIHHSCGSNWLSNSLNEALISRPYIGERNDIYYGVDVSPDTGRPDSLGPTPGENTNMNHWILWFNDYLGGVKEHGSGTNGIIMFKSCYPISNIGSDGSEPGDPFSGSQTLTNYKAVFRHPSGPGNAYTQGGYTYKPLEDVFAANPGTLFVFVVAPPLCNGCTDDDNAHRARVFANWVKGEWLSGYNADHPAAKNVIVYDFFDTLANPDDAASYPNRLRDEFTGPNAGDSHPNSAGNWRATEVFMTDSPGLLDTAWKAFAAQ